MAEILAGRANPATGLIRIISVSAQPPQPRSPRRSSTVGIRPGVTAALGAVLGVATALLALGIAQLVAALLNSQVGGPVDAVGELSIDHTPPAVKNFAIREFGSSDKTALITGIWIVLLIFAVIIGVLALHRLWLGIAGLAVFAIIGILASESQPTSKVTDILPTLIGGLAGALLLRYVAGLAGRRRGLRPVQQSAAPPSWQPGQHSPPESAPRPGQAGPSAEQPAEPGGAEPDTWDASAPSPTGPGVMPDGPVGPYVPPDYARRAPASQPPAGGGPGGPGGLPPQPWVQPQPSPRPDAVASPNRRRFLAVSAAAAAGGLVVYKAGSWISHNRDVSAAQQSIRLPVAATPAPTLPAGYDLKIPGLSPFITPNASFYRVDTAIVLPEILPASWSLRIHGMVERELTVSFDDLVRRPLIEDYITLCCVSNPVGGPYIGNAKWLGASLRSLLQKAGIKAGADQLLCTSSDGFTSGTPVQTAMDGRDALLAVAMNDTALPVEHGFPVRLVIPGLYGYVSACKWITDIEVTTYAANASYWAQRGWSAQAPIKTESRIDVPAAGASIKAGRQTAIAGEAWAQHKGIEAVEVRISNGAWQQAQLATVPDIDTWRQWVYYWDAAVPPGNYLIEARATDKTGYTQTSLAESPEPNGASGYPSVVASVTH
jgi:DMSO/TMAO reductase YedYZ molybdopterin-dependent catalytic subunit